MRLKQGQNLIVLMILWVGDTGAPAVCPLPALEAVCAGEEPQELHPAEHPVLGEWELQALQASGELHGAAAGPGRMDRRGLWEGRGVVSGAPFPSTLSLGREGLQEAFSAPRPAPGPQAPSAAGGALPSRPTQLGRLLKFVLQ